MAAVAVSGAHRSIYRQNDSLLYTFVQTRKVNSGKPPALGDIAVALCGGVLRTRRLDCVRERCLEVYTLCIQFLRGNAKWF